MLSEPTTAVLGGTSAKQAPNHRVAIDPYMGTYSESVSLLYRIVDIAIVNASEPANLDIMMRETIKM